MIDIRQFIRNLGDDAPAYFDTKPETVKRWIKTGNVPIKVAQKIYAAAAAIEKSGAPAPQPVQQAPAQPTEDPLTHLPVGLRSPAPQIGGGRARSAGGTNPDWVEQDPTEQSFGNNMTRPGRVEVRPLPPMKLRDEGGQKVAYVDNTPKAPTVLPPTIANEGWAAKGNPLPAPKKEPNPNDPRPAQRPTESVPQE